MRRNLWWLALGLLLLIAALAGYRLSSPEKTGVALPPAPGASIYDLVLKDTKGNPQALAQWRGRILVVNYWATWCFPCREEMPGFARIHTKLSANGVQFVGISSDEPTKIDEFIQQTPVSYPLLVAGMNTVTDSAKFGNNRQALPFTVVFDREGNLAMSKLGRWQEDDLESRLQDLIRR